MLSHLLQQAREDRPLWLPDMRAAFLQDPAARHLTLRLTKHDGTRQDFPCSIPRWETEEEQRLAAEFFHACIYNLLSVYSGRELLLYFDTADQELCTLYDSLRTVFQLGRTQRQGYGKVISIASRIAASCGGEAFRFSEADLSA